MTNYITELSLADFRKLDITLYYRKKVQVSENTTRFDFIPMKANELIDVIHNMRDGREPLKTLLLAIHDDQENAPDLQDMLFNNCYFDKFMNPGGMQTYQIAENPGHVYSTRDYFELHEDYWRVRKDETKALYLIHIED